MVSKLELPIAWLVAGIMAFFIALSVLQLGIGLVWVQNTLYSYSVQAAREEADAIARQASYHFLTGDFSSLERLAERCLGLAIFSRDRIAFSRGHVPLDHLRAVSEPVMLSSDQGQAVAHMVLPMSATGSWEQPDASRYFVHIAIATPWYLPVLARARTVLFADHAMFLIVAIPVALLIFGQVRHFARKFTEQAEASMQELDETGVFNLGLHLGRLKIDSKVREVRIILQNYNALVQKLVGMIMTNKALADSVRQAVLNEQYSREYAANLFAHEISRHLAMIVSTVCDEREFVELCGIGPEVSKRLIGKFDEILAYANNIRSNLKSTVSVIQGENIVLDCRPFEVDDFFAVIENIARHLLRERCYEVHAESRSEYFYADMYKLCQVVCIVLDNIQKHVPQEAMVWIRLSCADDIRIQIQDSGPGIPPDVVGKIFDPFFKSRSSGLGFGLYQARRIIDAMRGEIRVGGEQGAMFDIRVPPGSSRGSRPRDGL